MIGKLLAEKRYSYKILSITKAAGRSLTRAGMQWWAEGAGCLEPQVELWPQTADTLPLIREAASASITP